MTIVDQGVSDSALWVLSCYLSAGGWPAVCAALGEPGGLQGAGCAVPHGQAVPQGRQPPVQALAAPRCAWHPPLTAAPHTWSGEGCHISAPSFPHLWPADEHSCFSLICPLSLDNWAGKQHKRSELRYESSTSRLRCRRVAAGGAVCAEDCGADMHGLAGPAVAGALGRPAQEAESGARPQCVSACQWRPRDGAPGEAEEALISAWRCRQHALHSSEAHILVTRCVQAADQ